MPELSSEKKLEQFLTALALKQHGSSSTCCLEMCICQPSPAALHGGDETPNAPADSNRKNFLQRH